MFKKLLLIALLGVPFVANTIQANCSGCACCKKTAKHHKKSGSCKNGACKGGCKNGTCSIH